MANEELDVIAQNVLDQQAKLDHLIYVCTGTACVSTGSDKVLEALNTEIKARGLEHKCTAIPGGCRGMCARGPLVSDEPSGTMYQEVQAADAPQIIDHLDAEPVEHLWCPTDTPFFTQQRKIVLENSGKLNPDRIEDYIAREGYRGLINALTDMSPNEVLDQLTRSGLRGRGGAGYPTGLKWSTVAKADDSVKFVICNGDEGDPGAFMDRSVMEADPHRILEGMAIAAYAVGAQRGFIYVRAEYPLAVKRLNAAIRQAEKLKLLGNGIFGTPFNFDVEVRLGAGAFVCGEETALMASIEGKRGQPRPRPPYPAESGLWGHPTLINNAETFANIAPILRNGAEWFSAIGTERSKGTKVFSLTGRINNTGLIEVPMGITLREIIFDIGGGIPDGKRFKAVQTGGPSGGCIPEEYIDMQIDYESLRGVGSMMGSGGLIVMDETSCMVDVAKYFMEFSMSESCGKCIPCRVGTATMYNILDKITRGEANMEDLALLEELCDMVQKTSLCGLGQAAPTPIISTLRFFRHEYEAHIHHKTCPAGVCKIHNPQKELLKL